MLGVRVNHTDVRKTVVLNIKAEMDNDKKLYFGVLLFMVQKHGPYEKMKWGS
jgi:hypothetical protein